MTPVWVGVGGVTGAFALRVAQLAWAEVGTVAWWFIEAARWGVVLGLVIAGTQALRLLQREVMKHREILEQIKTEAIWERLEIDVVALDEYRQPA